MHNKFFIYSDVSNADGGMIFFVFMTEKDKYLQFKEGSVEFHLDWFLNMLFFITCI
jgi:hypothetical protein